MASPSFVNPGMLLGSGGFAEVYTVVENGQHFARKILRSDDAADLARFKREVQLLSSLDHPNIVKVLRSQFEASPYWFEMPLYSGNLRQELSRRRSERPDFEWVQTTFLRVLDGVDYLHRNKIIHRDLKPENILLNDHEVVVADLGLGRNIESDSVQLTKSSDMLGTLEYAAPEQVDSSKEHRSSPTLDVFSLGKILYDFLVDRPRGQAFDHKNLPAIFRSLYKRATESAPEGRHQTVDDLRSDFVGIMGHFVDGSENLGIDKMVEEFKESPDAHLRRNITARAIRALADQMHDPQSLFTAVMSLTGELFEHLEHMDPISAQEFVSRFCEYAKSTTDWAFDFTDSIADKAEEIFLACQDQEIRAMLADMTLVVGTGYNRYYVMATLGCMLSKVQDPVEIAYFRQRLGAHALVDRRTAREHFGSFRLAPALSQLFPSS